MGHVSPTLPPKNVGNLKKKYGGQAIISIAYLKSIDSVFTTFVNTKKISQTLEYLRSFALFPLNFNQGLESFSHDFWKLLDFLF